MNIAVFCSGKGTNLQAIIDAVKSKKVKAGIKLVIADKKNALSLVKAEKAGIKAIFINSKRFKSRESFDKEAIKYLKKEKVELVVLAGFMRILSPHFIKKYRDRILNVHPALLPSFKGSRAIKDAFDSGVKVTGVTVHFVSEEVDSGPIILQEAVKVSNRESYVSLERKIHKVEHRLYPLAIRLFCEGRLKVSGGKVFCEEALK
ncbi:MAG: phosphoribosylglycinamide formyltransferase [Candidatus Omnitrophica bacterium]|nr:phosphoribosylglycinamide formyltransferase [Candidatus Omnitrophota bacterium]